MYSGYSIERSTLDYESEDQYDFDEETRNKMIYGDRFKIKDDYRFKELPELTKYRATKMTDALKKRIQQNYDERYERARLRTDMQEANNKRVSDFGINDYYVKKNMPTNFHNNFIDLNQEVIRAKR